MLGFRRHQEILSTLAIGKVKEVGDDRKTVVRQLLFFTFYETESHLSNERGFNGIGYHYYITRDGQLHLTRSEAVPGAHARHFNTHSIGICYEGGLDEKGRPADTRTAAQKRTLLTLLYSLRTDYPKADILGHRDLPGVQKSCPCFLPSEEYKDI